MAQHRRHHSPDYWPATKLDSSVLEATLAALRKRYEADRQAAFAASFDHTSQERVHRTFRDRFVRYFGREAYKSARKQITDVNYWYMEDKFFWHLLNIIEQRSQERLSRVDELDWDELQMPPIELLRSMLADQPPPPTTPEPR
jgi:hypothetical protein